MPALIGAPKELVQSPVGALDGAALDLRAERTYDTAEFLDKKEAGAIVGLNPKTIERAILRGELKAYKPAGQVRIRRIDLDSWIESTVVEPSIHDI